MLLETLLTHIDTAAANGEPAADAAPALDAEEPKKDEAEAAEVNQKRRKKKIASFDFWGDVKNCAGKIVAKKARIFFAPFFFAR